MSKSTPPKQSPLARFGGPKSVHSADDGMFALGIGQGDEIICPATTYWASALPVFTLGGTVVFADIDPRALCLDPNDIERHISPRTKAIVAVHYLGHPADMDAIMDIAGRHGLKVLIGSNMAGWYGYCGLYRREKLGGLSITRFCEAVRAEGFPGASAGCNKALHTHPAFNDVDIYGQGRPTRIANSSRDLRQPPGSLPVAERIGHEVFFIPWFKHFRPEVIREHAAAFRKVAEHAAELTVNHRRD